MKKLSKMLVSILKSESLKFRSMKSNTVPLYMALIISMLAVSGCNNNTSNKSANTTDSVATAVDTVNNNYERKEVREMKNDQKKPSLENEAK